MKRNIQKVKYSPPIVSIEFEDTETHTGYKIECQDAPAPSFCNALQNLQRLLPAWLQLDPAWTATCVVRGATFSYKDGAFNAAMFTSLRKTSGCNAPMCLNTPGKLVADMSSMECDYLQALMVETNRYLDGIRAQMELPIPDDDGVIPDDETQPE